MMSEHKYIDATAICADCQQYGNCLGTFMDCQVAQAPSADVAPVIHANWVKHGPTGYLCCSNCHNCYVEEDWLAYGKWGFCPSCGAKMEVDKSV